MRKLLFLLLVMALSAQTAWAQFAGGDGSAGNPYQIETMEQLQSVSGGNIENVFVTGNNDGGTVTNIYWDADQSSPVEGVGHGDPATNMQGLSTEEMTGPAAAENMDALDFESIWATTEDDYPVLLWQVDQTIREPESPNMLQVLPHEFNMDTEDINWDRYTFHPFEGARLVRVENPDASGINETEFVLEYEKQDGAAAWGGFFYQVEPFNLTDESVFTMQVWSPRKDIEAIMKLEQFEGPGDTGDMFADVTQQGEWIELEWDLSDLSQDIDWNRVTIIMDLDMDMDNMP